MLEAHFCITKIKVLQLHLYLDLQRVVMSFTPSHYHSTYSFVWMRQESLTFEVAISVFSMSCLGAHQNS